MKKVVLYSEFEVTSTTPGRVWRHLQQGFSLIEVLVTMVILSLGLLGVAGLLVKGVAEASSSEAQSKANQLIADMADRIRANPAAANSANSEYITLFTDPPPASPTSIALQDLVVWKNSLAAQLPQGQGQIEKPLATGNRRIDISVRWSSCLGSLTNAEEINCSDEAANTFRTIHFQLWL